MKTALKDPRPEQDDVQRLWRRYRRRRDRRVRDRLAEHYLPVVFALAARLAQRLPRHVDADDLRSAGLFGLLEAIDHFDPERGVTFEGFCRKRVAGAMLDELRRQDMIPREARDRAGLLDRVEAELRERLGREPSEREVAAAMRVKPAACADIRLDRMFANRVSLECTDGESGDDVACFGFEPIDAIPLPPEQVWRRELIQLVDRHLSRRERTIVQSYYHDEQTMKRIGSRLRLSESRVCQMHARMLSRLKARLRREVAP